MPSSLRSAVLAVALLLQLVLGPAVAAGAMPSWCEGGATGLLDCCCAPEEPEEPAEPAEPQGCCGDEEPEPATSPSEDPCGCSASPDSPPAVPVEHGGRTDLATDALALSGDAVLAPTTRRALRWCVKARAPGDERDCRIRFGVFRL